MDTPTPIKFKYPIEILDKEKQAIGWALSTLQVNYSGTPEYLEHQDKFTQLQEAIQYLMMAV